MTELNLQEAKQLKNEMEGYFTPQGKYVSPKGILNALDSYLNRQ